MKTDHIKEIYDAKYSIVRNGARIIELLRRNDVEGAYNIRRENDAIRKRIRKEYGIILD